MDTRAAATRFLLFGFAGWLMERSLYPTEERYSKLFGGAKIPLLPVYGLGGIALGPLARRRSSTAGKFATYAAAFTGVELAAGILDRANGKPSWDYDGAPIDLGHAVIWGALGLLAESAIRNTDPKLLNGV